MKICIGDGSCYWRSDNGRYIKSKFVTCSHNCHLVNCNSCHYLYPLRLLDPDSAQCEECHIAYEKGWKGIGYCRYCLSDRKLPPIGEKRTSGMKHKDWENRLYHKSCWYELNKEE